MDKRLFDNFDELNKINNELRLISINARIEASKASEEGRKFSVIAEEMSNTVKKLNASINSLENNLKEEI